MPDGIWAQVLGVITLFWCFAYTPCGCGDVLYLSTLLAKAVYSRLNERGRGRQNNFKPGVPEWDPSCRCRGLQIRSWRLVCIFAMQRAAQSGRREHVFCTPAAKCAARRYQFACLLPSFYVDRNAPFQKPLRTPHPSGLCIPPACSAQAIAVISTNLFALNAGGPSSSRHRSPGPLLSLVSRPHSTRRIIRISVRNRLGEHARSAGSTAPMCIHTRVCKHTVVDRQTA